MSFLELTKKRYSARSYLEKPVEREKLDIILEAGRVAPTACNNQPQRILVVNSKEGLEKISKSYKSFGAPLALVVCVDHNNTWKRAYDGKNSADIDASIVCDHMMLCAADIGLDSVWVCAFNPEVLRKEFNIPDHIEPVNILFVGYAKGEPKSPKRHDSMRKPVGSSVFYEKFE